MRYLKPLVIYQVHGILRTILTKRGEGATFSPELPLNVVVPKLDQAANRPRHIFSGKHVHEGLFRKVAALGHAIVRNHVFGNGNKRTAFLAMEMALSWNGWLMSAAPPLVAFLMIRMAGKTKPLTVDEAADLMKGFSRPLEGHELEQSRIGSAQLIERDLLWVEEPDEFPAKAVVDKAEQSQKIVADIVDKHLALIEPDEFEELQAGIPGVTKFFKLLTAFTHSQEYKVERSRRRRTRTKRCGVRLPPNLGGRRTVPKICRPITRAKQRLPALQYPPKSA